MANLYWVANSPALFDSANWSYSSGGPSGAPTPGASDNIFFDALGTGNCTLNNIVNISSLSISPGYIGSIIQNGHQITIYNNANFGGGTFIGSGANIFVEGDFLLNGSNFTNTDQTLSVWGSFQNNAGTFSDNYGTFKSIITNQNFYPNDTTFNHLQFDVYNPLFNYEWLNGHCYVKGNLNLTAGILRATFDSTIHAQGDIYCYGNYGSWSSINNAQITMDGSGVQVFNSEGGVIPHLVIEKPNSNQAIVRGPADIYLNGDLVINDGTFNLNNHDIVMQGGKIDIPVQFPPIANFSWSVDSLNYKRINFMDLSLNLPSSWDWNWGDGSAHGTTENPYHIFANYDTTYAVTLTASNYLGSDSTTINVATKPNPVPIADYTWSIDSSNPLLLHFTDLSINNPTTWDWSWGDGSANGSTQNPDHSFPNFDSTYTVTLIASNIFGSDSTSGNVHTSHNPVSVPVANFSWALDGSDVRQIHFTDLSLNTPTSWDWTWGDGSAHGTIQNPSHTYADYDTTYAVTLNATNTAGTGSTTINVVTGHYFYVDYSWGQLPEV